MHILCVDDRWTKGSPWVQLGGRRVCLERWVRIRNNLVGAMGRPRGKGSRPYVGFNNNPHSSGVCLNFSLSRPRPSGFEHRRPSNSKLYFVRESTPRGDVTDDSILLKPSMLQET